jgi:predicted HicB family RNase H-like nuclease
MMTMKEPKPKRETKQASIAIRTTQSVKDKAEDAALSENRSLSQWIESLILSAIKKKRQTAFRED